MEKYKVEYKTRYFVGEKHFENRTDAEYYAKHKEIADFLSGCCPPDRIDIDGVTDALLQKYTIEQRYDYTDLSQNDTGGE